MLAQRRSTARTTFTNILAANAPCWTSLRDLAVGRRVARGMASTEKPRFPVLAGWIAGSLEIVVTYPLEFVKTQLQLQVTSSARAGPRALTTQAL